MTHMICVIMARFDVIVGKKLKFLFGVSYDFFSLLFPLPLKMVRWSGPI